MKQINKEILNGVKVLDYIIWISIDVVSIQSCKMSKIYEMIFVGYYDYYKDIGNICLKNIIIDLKNSKKQDSHWKLSRYFS